jgi:hypothetical protein
MGEEPAGGREIPFLCDEDVNDLAKLVDRPVQIDPPAADFDVDTPRESVVKRRQFRVSAKRLFRGRACWSGGSTRVWTAVCSRGCGARRYGCHRRLCGGRSGLRRRMIGSAWRKPTSGRRRPGAGCRSVVRDDTASPRRAGDGGCPGETAQPTSIGEPVRVIAKLAENAGAHNGPESGEPGDDRGLGVLVKQGVGFHKSDTCVSSGFTRPARIH